MFLGRTATVPRPEIREWMPLSLLSVPGQIFLGLLLLGVASFVATGRRRSFQAVVIFGVAAILPFVSSRHYPLFALTLVALGGQHIAGLTTARPTRPGPSRFGHDGRVAIAGVLAALVFAACAVPRFGCIRVEPFYFPYPARALAFLAQSGLSGNMAVPFDWGEYAIWHLAPGSRSRWTDGGKLSTRMRPIVSRVTSSRAPAYGMRY